MSDDQEKTEEPTHKKLEDAKKEGNVNKSAEVVGATTLFFGTIYLIFFSSYAFDSIQKLMKFCYGFIGEEITPSTYFALAYTFVTTSLYVLAPFFILIVILTLMSNWVQFGMIFTPMKMDLKKLDPIKGITQIFSLKKGVEALKLMAKLLIIVLVSFVLLAFTKNMFLEMMNMELNASIDTMILLIIYFLASILLIIIIFAIIDFYFTRHYYMESLKMSKQEVKDEYKNMDGDPEVKGRIRRIQMEMAQKRMMSDVPDADVVITNPTHYAVALKYDNKVSSAPKVVGKGIDFIAIKIKDIARENDIPIIENPSLARALHDQIEVDHEIPEEFYKALAEIFSYVYELKKR